MRLLVLDGSRVLIELVRRLVPPGVEVESADSFEQALAILGRDPPGAAIVNLGPARLPWRRLQEACHKHKPPIPVLYESAVFDSPTEAGMDNLNACSTFIPKPYSIVELRRQIQRLLREADDVEHRLKRTDD